MTDIIDRLAEALRRYYESPCPNCDYDCASANPPIASCITAQAHAALAAYDAVKDRPIAAIYDGKGISQKSMTIVYGAAPLAKDAPADDGRREALLDSMYRMGVTAGWKAAHLPTEDEQNEKLAALIKVNPGDMAVFSKRVSSAPDDGWIPWGGGDCPVDGETLVDIRIRNSRTHDVLMGERAGKWNWKNGSIAWITAYRPTQVTAR